MGPLSNEQKQLLFDFAMGLASEAEAADAKMLISAEKEAAEIYSALKSTLSPLDCYEVESCPDELVERTVLRLNDLARASQQRLEQLLATEQGRAVEPRVKVGLWGDFGKRLATAAVFMVVGGLLITAMNMVSSYARQNSRRQQCKMQLANIWRGVNHYTADNDGKLPSVATANGAPWWKVGYQGSENHSNTRHLWLLVKGDYVSASDFTCPGSNRGRDSRFELVDAQNLSDFPTRKDVTYSFRIMCGKTARAGTKGPEVLIADLNPLFERLPAHYSDSFVLKPSKDLLARNSMNHRRSGQNVLFCNGSVKFIRTRRPGIARDDIFTLKDTSVYKGCEVPSSETDAFLAP